jgi:hypothetical protein
MPALSALVARDNSTTYSSPFLSGRSDSRHEPFAENAKRPTLRESLRPNSDRHRPAVIQGSLGIRMLQ